MKSNPSELVSGPPESHPFESGWFAALKREARQLVGIDVRSLAAFRIGLGLLLLADLGSRSDDLVAHYTDNGVLPRAAAIDLYNDNAHFSLHLMSGAWQIQVALFVLAGVFAAMLLVGYRTRQVTIVCWVLLVSLHTRNTLVLNGGDTLLRVLLFWAMFLPLGAACSWDSWRSLDTRSRDQLVISVSSFALLIQICLMYWFSFLFKSDPIWTREGSAISYALNVDQITKPFGRWLLNYPEMLKYMSYATLWLEGMGPFLFFVPFVRRWSRPLMVGVFASFHISIFLCMALGLFPWACCVGLLLFLPSTFWDSLSAKAGAGHRVSYLVQNVASKLGQRFQLQPTIQSVSMSTRRVESFSSIYRPVVGNLVALMFLCLVVLWNISTLSTDSSCPNLPEVAWQVTRLARLEQDWGMFAPYPSKDDGWFIIPGELADGSEVDLFTWGGTVTDNKPTHVYASFGNARWRKYMENLWNRRHRRARLYYGKYLMRKWNRDFADDPDKELQRFKIYYWEELTQLEGPQRLRKVQIWSHAKNPDKESHSEDDNEQPAAPDTAEPTTKADPLGRIGIER